MNTRTPHFIYHFNPNNTTTTTTTTIHKLKLPSKFIKHLEGKTTGTVYLTGPSGNTWHADLAQEPDGLFILNGWATFVRDHFLENGDTLIFKYDGNLSFTLQIFDQSCCQKETAFSAECHQDLSIFDQHFGKKRDHECANLFNNMGDCVPKKPRSSQVEMHLGLQESINDECEVADFLNNVDFCSGGLKNHVNIVTPISEVRPNDDELGRLSVSEAEKIAQSFTSTFPHFTQVMKRFNISGSYTMNVPYQFAMAHLPNSKVKILLHNLKGETWTVNSIPTTRVQTSHTFCGGWLAFVRGNSINVRDVCIFELVGKCEMCVNILRVRQEQDSLDHEHGDFNGSTNGPVKVSGRLNKKVKRKSLKTQIPALIESQKFAFSIEKVKHGIAAKGSSGPQLKTTNGISGKTRVFQENRGSSMTGFTSMKSGPEEKIAAESFVSSFPYFVRVMKKFNISGSYTLVSSHLKSNPVII
ncbi:B3 domain-containing protein Os11g0197600-like isoform X2 [Bidens hawaiensis]|uniref:B3 domain-containing protein Os11g0197600-like isoform X2 n=1 Tax=Bidens hawaiensis TaxID=980011 RepID=UPI0040499609